MEIALFNRQPQFPRFPFQLVLVFVVQMNTDSFQTPRKSTPMDSIPEDRCAREGMLTPPNPPSSTPIKPKNQADRLFSTFTCYRHPTVNKIGKGMMGSMVGPMPVEEFLERFFPTSHIPDYSSMASTFKEGVSFKQTMRAKNELEMYKPFVSISSCSTYVLLLS